MGEFIGFLAVFLIFGAIPLGTMFYLHKTKTKKLDTLIKIVELGGSVDPQMMKMLSEGGQSSYKTDYKKGLIWLAIGVPLSLGLMLENGINEAVFGTIPIFIGIAFLISGKYRLRDTDLETN